MSDFGTVYTVYYVFRRMYSETKETGVQRSVEKG